MRKAIIAAALGLMAAACNTISGFGKDLGAIGDAMTGASEEAQKGDKLDGGPKK